jgi:hypothetical protein
MIEELQKDMAAVMRNHIKRIMTELDKDFSETSTGSVPIDVDEYAREYAINFIGNVNDVIYLYKCGPTPIYAAPCVEINCYAGQIASAYGFFMDSDTQERSIGIVGIQPGKLISVLKFLRTEYRLDTFKLVPMLDVKSKLENLPLVLETFETRGKDYKERILDIMVDRDKLIAAGAILDIV